MRAAILSIGDELTLGQCVDTNSAWLAERLLARSIETVEHRTVPDDRDAIAAAVVRLVERCDLLVITGGLGPTDDDLTRQALGDVLTPGKDLVVDAAAEAEIRTWFSGRGRHMPPSNLIQARRPETMRMLPNRHGTAPGMAGTHGNCAIYVLPGPPREMRPMFERCVVADLPNPAARRCVLTETVHLYGLGESRAAELLGELTARDREPTIGTTASDAIISARIRAVGDADTARTALDDSAAIIEEIWRPYCFGRGGHSLAEAAGALLRAQGRTLVTAESCTGGWLGKLIVDVAGSSDYFRGGWITYANEMKQSCLDVPESLLIEHGAVSEPVARAMAAGALRHGGADFSLAISGVAGPGGGGPDKPAGLVYVALGRRATDAAGVIVRRFHFRGDRSVVRDRAAKSALQMLRFALLGVRDDQPLIWETAPESTGQVDGI